jgi:transposase InsO family protein
VARCTVERLMRGMGLQGAVRGKPVKTTVSDKAAPCPQDKVNRQFQAPRLLLCFFVRFCMQNSGRLSAAKRSQFAELTDAEIELLESVVQRAIAIEKAGHP